jgi:hypothetical protein
MSLWKSLRTRVLFGVSFALTWLGKTLRTDVLFWASLVLSLGGLLVPQIWTVLTQTVEAPALSKLSDTGKLAALVASPSTLEAAGFLVYLSLLGTVMLASVLFVVPPSFLAVSGNPAQPIRLPRPPRRRMVLATVLLLLLLPVFVLLPVPPLVLVGLTALLLFQPVSRLVGKRAGWLVRVAESTPSVYRRWVGAALVLLGLITAVVAGAHGTSSRLYPLAGSACQLFAGLGLLTGLWLLSVPAAVARGGTPLGTVRTALGRLLGWLIAASVFGELIWVLADVPFADRFISYRLYTIWAALTIPVLFVLIGSLLDTWEHAVAYPVRLGGFVVGLLLLLLAAPPEPLLAPPRIAEKPPPDNWPKYMLARVQTIPEGEPVVLVAAAGGGSRAAIFAGLVLESLAREPFPGRRPDDTWADHIVLVSGVSGGSLGTAIFVHRLDRLTAALRGPAGRAGPDPVVERDDLKNSVQAELVVRMTETADDLIELIENQARVTGGTPRPDYLDAAKKTAELCHDLREGLLNKQAPSEWVIRSAIMDDLCTDFMAPVFRGALAPGVSRGQTLRRFWTERFQWGDSSDRGGYGWRDEAPRFDPKLHPLVVFNASDVRRGNRLAIGFPPLPPGLLKEMVTDQPNDPARPEGPRYPPEVLGDLNPERSVSLAQAVGLSANFPFGFNVTTIPRAPGDKEESQKALEERGDLTAKVLDGGIVDNTGIDTLFLMIKAIEAGAGVEGPYRDLWKALRDRRVVLIEIDSGAKPEKPGPATRLLSVFFDPLAALNNASFTGAALDKQRYLSDLRATFQLPVNVSGPLRRLAEQPAAPPLPDDQMVHAELSRLQREGVSRFSTFPYSANHFGGDNVLTAWSLAPSDKALLLVRFLFERQLARGQLSELARLEPLTPDQERAKTEAHADEVVTKYLEQRAAQRLEQAVKAVRADLDEVERLRKEGGKSQEALLARLKKVEAGLDEARRLAGNRRARNPELDQRVRELERGVRDSRATLEKGELPTAAMLEPLKVQPGGVLDTAAADLTLRVKEAGEETQQMIDRVNPQERLQSQFNKRIQENRKLFDTPPPKK